MLAVELDCKALQTVKGGTMEETDALALAALAEALEERR